MSGNPSIQLNKCRDAALKAIEAGDWECALKEAQKAELIIATIPDSRIGNMSDLEWDRGAIRQFRKRLEEIVSQGEGCTLDICDVEFTGASSSSGSCCEC